MAKIKVLSTEVVNQIAAGEVVERPAHMVKEIVENAIDAEASELLIEFAQGGKFLKVKDNGKGIDKDDLELALSRHATSKIKTTDDIWNINSFGFRGDGLASISAVSKLQIISRTEFQKRAFRLSSEFGVHSKIDPCGGEVGTTVLIEELFTNLPARQKFLKSEAAENTQIKNVIKALALSNPIVNFRVVCKGELLYYWSSVDSHLKRAEQILEHEPLYYGEGECNNLRARVCIGAPNQTVKSSRQIWTFAQNRWVTDRGLMAAVLDAYRSLLMHGEYPVAVVWVDCPSEEIDVNVHPTKSQVKFQNSSDAFRAVHRAVKTILDKAPWLEGVLGSKTAAPESSFDRRPSDLSQVANLKFDANEFDQINYSQKKHFNSEMSLKQVPSESTEGESTLSAIKEVVDSVRQQSEHWSKLQVIGQIGLTYILCQSEDAMVLIDQHAAHERVAYERIMSNWITGDIEVQSLLIPFTCRLEPEQVEKIIEIEKELTTLGLFIEASGPEHILVRGHPLVVKESAVQKVLEVLGRELTEKGGSFALEKTLSGIAATLACHSVVRAGQALGHEQMTSLLGQMDEFPCSSFCPHGRPVYIEYPFSKLERDFGRLV